MNRLFSTAYEKLMVFHPARVIGLERLGDAFYLASLQGEALQGVTWVPGQTIQFLVADATKRAYTPMDMDPVAGTARFLFYRHGQGPGSTWAAALRSKDVCKLMRPKGSINFSQHEGPALFFGDETSFAAAHTLSRYGRKVPCHFIFEVDSLEDAQVVLSRLELGQVTLISKQQDGSHLGQALKELLHYASCLPSPSWFFTGRGSSIQTLHKGLKSAGVSLSRAATKAYWTPGHAGMH